MRFNPSVNWGTHLKQFVELRDWQPGNLANDFVVLVGGSSRYVIVNDVVNFLRAILEPTQLASIEARWEAASPEPGCCMRQAAAATHAAEAFVPLEQFAPLNSTPLVELLRGGRITSHFQPVFRADGKTVWGYECLMRGVAEEGQIIYPGELLAWAAQERLTFMLDRVCRETHIRNAKKALPENVSILINFLPTAIYEPSYCLKSTIAAAKSAGIEPDRIVFEVVETETVDQREHLTDVLMYYREKGFRIALDDVGEGFAGLNMLADLNPDVIKIDMSLVRTAVSSPIHKAICGALASIAKQCNRLCLAEGIETVEQFELMKSLGVDLFQGYYLARPAATAFQAASSPKIVEAEAVAAS
ncbi:hypothetical protein GCM10023155_44510 [Bremerella cremea]